MFIKILNVKISRLRNTEKKSELKNFDRIASGNFKKKVEKIEEMPYLAVEERAKKSGAKSREKNRLTSKSPMGKDTSS